MRSLVVGILGHAALAVNASANLTSRETDVAATDRLMFIANISEFIAAAETKEPPSLDWTTDGCSDSLDNPLGFNFHDSCRRHDFGYRNHKAQSRFTDANKARTDENFRADMYNQCKSEWFEDLCEEFADLYYEAVGVLKSWEGTPKRGRFWKLR